MHVEHDCLPPGPGRLYRGSTGQLPPRPASVAAPGPAWSRAGIRGALGAGVGLIERQAILIDRIGFGVAAMALWLAVVLAITYLLIPRRAGRLFRQQRTLAHDFTLAWDSTGLHQAWDGGTNHTPWQDYHDWFEDARIIAFGLNEQLYHFAPKRALTAAQADGLRTLAGRIAASGSPA